MKKIECIGALAVLAVCAGVFLQKENHAMEMGGFDVEVNTGEQWELPENREEPSISEETSVWNQETDVQPEAVETEEEIWGDGDDMWQFPQQETRLPAEDNLSAQETLSDTVQTAGTETISISEPAPTPEPTPVLEAVKIAESTPTHEPAQSVEPTAALQPTPTHEPVSSAAQPSQESFKCLPVVTDIQINGGYAQIRFQAETGLKLLSVRINGEERMWKWSGTVLTVDFDEREKKNKNCAELLIMLPDRKVVRQEVSDF